MTFPLVVTYETAIQQVNELRKYPESAFTQPIQPGKWSAREIIGHLYYWDKFILAQLLPAMKENGTLPSFPDVDLHNQEAIQYIESFPSVDSLMDAFTEKRKRVVEGMGNIETNIPFTIGANNFTRDSFLTIFVDHDAHHFKQIWDGLSNAK